MPNILFMLLISLLTIGLIEIKIVGTYDLSINALTAVIFYTCVFLLHYVFIWFPKAIKKSKALQMSVKIIFSAIDESVLDKEIKKELLNEVNKSVYLLAKVMDKKLSNLGNANLLKLVKDNNSEEAWKKFFLDAFSLIDKQLKDETVKGWTFKKIISKLNYQTPSYVKDTLKLFLEDSKYSYITE